MPRSLFGRMVLAIALVALACQVVTIAIVVAFGLWPLGRLATSDLAALMIEAAAQLSSYLFKVKTAEERFLGFTHVDKTSFRGQVVPAPAGVLAIGLAFTSRRRRR